jgi:DNA (cytosine-5)-methyltransferase 1
MRIFSTFTGIGGFEVGIQNASVGKLNTELVGYSEIDKYAVSVFEKHFKGVKNYGDITKIDAETLPDFDCLVGGFPCQAFSIAGKRAGFNDTRGTLFFDLARILQAKQPRLFVFENVKGLLNHDSGRTFKTIIQTIDELGYDCQWQVLNSKDFGVPQNRERIIIIGNLRGSTKPQVFPITGTNSQDIEQINNPKHSNDRIYSPEGLSPTLNTMQGGNRQPFIKVPEATKQGYAEATVGDSINLSQPNSKTRRGRVGKGIANTLDTGMQQYTIQPVQSPDRMNKKQNGRRIKPDGEPSHTLTATDRHGVMVKSINRIDGVGKELEVAHTLSASDYRGLNRNQNQNAVIDGAYIRRLTPVECERLQAFPDNWTKFAADGSEISDTQRYKMCGNAVTTNVIKAVFERIFV